MHVVITGIASSYQYGGLAKFFKIKIESMKITYVTDPGKTSLTTCKI